MMELEKFLRDKNMPLEMGVGLGSYVASLEAGKKVVKCFGSPTRKQWCIILYVLVYYVGFGSGQTTWERSSGTRSHHTKSAI